MQVKIQKTIDVLDLFLHEKGEYSPVDESWISEELTKVLNDYEKFPHLSEVYSDIEVCNSEDSGLDRFVIQVIWMHSSEPSYYVERCHTKTELKKLLPSDIYKALQKINKIQLTNEEKRF